MFRFGCKGTKKREKGKVKSEKFAAALSEALPSGSSRRRLGCLQHHDRAIAAS